MLYHFNPSNAAITPSTHPLPDPPLALGLMQTYMLYIVVILHTEPVALN